MDAIRILSRCRNGRADIERISDRLKRWEGVKGPDVDMPAEYVQLVEELRARKREYRVERVAACGITNMLGDLEGAVLYAYYVQGGSVAGFARDKHYSEGYIRNVKRMAELHAREIGDDVVRSLLPAWYAIG